MKKLFLFVTALFVTVLLAIAALLLMIDPNQFKPLLVEQTQKQTGLALNIEGDISWQLFPAVGLSLGHTELKNPQGFSAENLLKIDQIQVEVSLLPLLSNELYIGNVVLDGAEIHLETLKDGRSNLDSLRQEEAPQPASSAVMQGQTGDSGQSVDSGQSGDAPSVSDGQKWSINLAGITISNALLEVNDLQSGSYSKFYDVGLTVSEFAFDQWTQASFAAKGQSNQQHFSAQGEAEFKLDKTLADYQLRNIDLESSLNDATNQIDSVHLVLASFAFDQPSPVNLTVKGSAGDMALDLGLQASLLVDQAVSLVKLENINLDSRISGASLPQSPLVIKGQLASGFDLTKQQLSLILESLAINDIKLDGDIKVTLAEIPAIRLALNSPEIDLDAFLGMQEASTSNASESQPAAEQDSAPAESEPEVEPDLSGLKALDIAGKIAIDKFKAANAKMQNVNASFSVKHGIAKLTSFTSELYQGKINASAMLDATQVPATYTLRKQFTGVKVQPLLSDVAQNDMLEGTGNIDASLSGKSLTPSGIKQNLAGTVKIDFADGAVNGINVAQLIRTNYAKLKGQSLTEAETSVQKTDFSAMKATLKLAQGVISSDDLTLSSPLLRVHGEGQANYLKQSMDFLFDTSIVGSLQGQGGKDIDELKNLTIPVQVYNLWQDPKYRVMLDQIWKAMQAEQKKELEDKAKKEAERGLKKLLGDKAEGEETKQLADKLLKGLFN